MLDISIGSVTINIIIIMIFIITINIIYIAVIITFITINYPFWQTYKTNLIILTTDKTQELVSCYIYRNYLRIE